MVNRARDPKGGPEKGAGERERQQGGNAGRSAPIPRDDALNSGDRAERRVGAATLAFSFLGSAVLWAIHFNLVYFLNTLFCSGGWGSGDVVVMLTAVPFGAASAASGSSPTGSGGSCAGRSLRGAGRAGGRSSVLLVMGIAASVLFTLLIVLESFAPIYVPSCRRCGREGRPNGSRRRPAPAPAPTTVGAAPRRCRHRRSAAVALLTWPRAIALAAGGCHEGAVEAGVAVGRRPGRGPTALDNYGCGECTSSPGARGGLVDRPAAHRVGRPRFIAGALQYAGEPDALHHGPGLGGAGHAMPDLGVDTAAARHMAAYLFTLRLENPIGPPHPLPLRWLESLLPAGSHQRSPPGQPTQAPPTPGTPTPAPPTPGS